MNIKQLNKEGGVIHVNKIKTTLRVKYLQWKECFYAKNGVQTGCEYYINNNGVNFLICGITNLKRK